MVVVENELGVVALFFGIWASGKLLNALKSSPLLGHILLGTLLGPPLADAVPYPDAWRLIGKLGVLLFVAEGGMLLSVEELRAVGARAFLAALLGVIFPVGLAIGFLASAYSSEFSFKSAMAAGAAIAPTSLGFSAQLMSEVGVLNTSLGRMVCVAAVFDDVLSLILLAEVQALTDDDDGGGRSLALKLLLPLLGSLGSIIIGILLVVVVPKFVERIIFTHFETGPRRDQVLLFSLLSLATAFGFLCALVGSSDLLGCFMAGLAFSGVDGMARRWDSQLKRIVQWGVRVFFAATIGFALPRVETLFAGESVLCGLGLFVAAVLGKLVVGAFATPLTLDAALMFGFAMTGRGEFSFLIADLASEDGLLTPKWYSGAVLGSLLASIVSPFGFRWAAMRTQRHQPAPPSEEENDEEVTSPPPPPSPMPSTKEVAQSDSVGVAGGCVGVAQV